MSNMKIFFATILISFMVFSPMVTFAQSPGLGGDNGSSGLSGDNGSSGLSGDNSQVVIENPISVSTINEFILRVLEGAIKLGIPVIVLAIIYSGFLFVSAQGNAEKISQAKKSLMATLIGAAILLGSLGIAELITETIQSL